MSRVLTLAAIALAYFAAGKVGLSLAFVNESASAVWPPAGIAVAAAILCGARVWPALAAGAFAVNVTTSGGVATSLAIAAGNTLEALAAGWLITRFAAGRAAFDRTPDIVRFAAAAAAAATIAATAGTLTLLAAGLAEPAAALAVWGTWWFGDACGMVVVAPLIVLWAMPGRERWTPARTAEAFALAALLTLTAVVLFGDTPPGRERLQLQFLIIPFLLWAAFRFGGRETALAAAIVSVLATRGTLGGFGPFVRDAPNEGLLILGGFIAVVTLIMLSVAAEASARARAEGEMRALNEVLEARVAARTEELRRVHDRLVDAQRVAHVGSWEWDVAANALWWSDEMRRIYGFSADEPITYEKYVAAVHPDDRSLIQAAVDAAAATGQPFSFDHRIIHPDGSTRVLHGQGQVILGPEGRAVRMMGTGHDITERVVAEEQRARLQLIEAAHRDAAAASRAKDQFLATLSHELRTPLNVALGWTQLLKARPLEAEAARAADTIARNLQILSRLVDDIMDVSRIAAGTLALRVEEFDAAALVGDVVETIRPLAAARRVAIETSVDADPAWLIRGDADRLRQVIWNLLANAVKFTPDDGRVLVSLRRAAAQITLVVEDNGPGIDEAFLPYVFDPFRQADSSLTREHGGLGLGLAIARQLVTLHGGSIAAGNREGGGAVFTVHLPRETGGDAAMSHPFVAEKGRSG